MSEDGKWSISIRLPQDLADEVRERAAASSMSANALIVNAVAASFGGDGVLKEKDDQIAQLKAMLAKEIDSVGKLSDLLSSAQERIRALEAPKGGAEADEVVYEQADEVTDVEPGAKPTATSVETLVDSVVVIDPATADALTRIVEEKVAERVPANDVPKAGIFGWLARKLGIRR